MLAFVSVAVSGILLWMLCRGDPKRRRAARLDGGGHEPATRRVIAFAACLPGLACALRGDPAAFLIWLGGCGAIGWLIALWHGARQRRDIGR